MDFDTSWDVDKYKSDHECDEHWHFKQYLGCKYPQSTMDLIESLSTCMVDDLRAKRNEKLQRTLIAASDAAQAKAKGYSQTTTKIINNSLTKNIIKLITPYDPEYILKGFILLVGNTEDPFQILYRSCTFCGIQKPEILYSTSNPQNIQADLYLQNKFIISGCGSTKKIARKNVFERAYNNLKENCFIIKVKDDEKNPKVNKSDILIEENLSVNNSTNKMLKIDTTENNKNQIQLANDNIGNKLLKMMGWTGGGLGKYNQGRIDPIEVVQLPKYKGLGNKEIGQIAKQKMLFALQKEVNIHIKKFINSKMKKLTFSTEFTKDERELIHKKSVQFGLKTKSYGRNENRYIVISKKENSNDIFQELFDNGYENDYYILIPPKKLIVD